MTIPAELRRSAGRSAVVDAWLDRLPRLQQELVTDWRLTIDGAPTARSGALLLDVRDDDRRPAVLKINGPDRPSQHEHLALRAWDGSGAVRLLRADPRRAALLTDRLPGPDLNGTDVVAACRIVADCYPRLHRAALPQLQRLSEASAGWVGRLAALRDHQVVPRRLVDHAIGLAGDFAADAATDGRLIHTNLHYGTLLAGADDHGPGWLAVDPRPISGDPLFEVAPLLWHRWPEAVATGNLRNAVLERIWTVVDHAGQDEDRTRDWVIVRALVRALQVLGRGAAPDSDQVTALIVIAKAAQR